MRTVDRLDFSNETTSAPGSTLPQATTVVIAAFSSNSYGYFGGGTNGSTLYSRIRRLDFSNETLSNPGSILLSSKKMYAATESNSYGYFAGGDGPPPEQLCLNTIDRLDFSSETMSLPGNNLPAAREDWQQYPTKTK